jgi:hypothetical protein
MFASPQLLAKLKDHIKSEKVFCMLENEEYEISHIIAATFDSKNITVIKMNAI